MDRCFTPAVTVVLPRLPSFVLTFILYPCYLIYSSTHRFLRMCYLVKMLGCYHTFVFIVQMFRHSLGDCACSRSNSPNSVSGHAHAHVFHCCLWLSWYRSKHRPSTFTDKLFLAITLSVHSANQIITYVGGYHTPRQLCYGAFFGFLNFGIAGLMANRLSLKGAVKLWGLVILAVIAIASQMTHLKAIKLFHTILWYIFALLVVLRAETKNK